MRNLLCLLFLAAVIVGCASVNPNAGQKDPTTGAVQPPYLPNKTVTDGVAGAQPYVGLVPAPYNTAVEAALLLATGIAGIVAGVKNKQAGTATATATQLATSVVAQGPTVAQAVLDHASANEAVYPAVANLVNLKTV